MDYLVLILLAFLGAYFAYFFGVKTKKKDVDLEYVKELNEVLASLMSVWYYLTRIELAIKVLNSGETDSGLPIKYIPTLMLKSERINKNCFSEFEHSILNLKKYDPILYFRMEGIGRATNQIQKEIILPMLDITNVENNASSIASNKLLASMQDDIEEFLEIISKMISEDTNSNVREYIASNREENADNIIKSIISDIESMFNEMTGIDISDEYGSVRDLLKSDEGKRMMDVVFQAVANQQYADFVQIINANPLIQPEELEQLLKKN